jgi:hypothetical protein
VGNVESAVGAGNGASDGAANGAANEFAVNASRARVRHAV